MPKPSLDHFSPVDDVVVAVVVVADVAAVAAVALKLQPVPSRHGAAYRHRSRWYGMVLAVQFSYRSGSIRNATIRQKKVLTTFP